MNSNKLIKSILGSTFVLVIIIVIIVGVTYFKLSPNLNEIFKRGEILQENQVVNDSLITLLNIETKEIIEHSLKDETTLCFIKILDHINLDDIKKNAKEYMSKEKNDLFLIVDDTSHFVKIKIKESTIGLPVYYCNKKHYPFTVKDIIHPYILRIKDYKVISSKIGDIKN